MSQRDQKIRVLAVDDHAILREGVAALISSQSDMELVAEAASGREALALHHAHNPHVTLVDLALPDMSGVDVIRAIRQQLPKAKFVVLTTFRGDVQALRALKAGASGYLLKSMLRKDLLETIRTVHAGGKRIPPEISFDIAAHATGEELSEREIEVLAWVAEGSSNKVVAARLGISEDTVKNHMRTILAKLGANDRTHAVTIAIRRGFLDLR
ncbi:response regulator [Phenylobacterium sp.]|uniref:response regulator n=1 Tax=Phenylobacterium sp. TaxID=1871053 RepID=UPI0035B06337